MRVTHRLAAAAAAACCLCLHAAPSLGATVCVFPVSAELVPPALAVRHAVRSYAAAHPAAGPWDVLLLGNGQPDVHPMAVDYVKRGMRRCDAIAGPGYSRLAAGISPLVQVPWVDFWATHPTLADKTLHPTFSRVVNSDDNSAGAAAAFMVRHAGWRDAAVLHEAHAYGRAWATAFISHLLAAGGAVHAEAELPAGAGETDIGAVLRRVAAGPCRVVVVAGSPSAEMAALVAVVRRERLDERLIFFFSDWVCGSDDNAYAALRSAFCLSFDAGSIQAPRFSESYATRNLTDDQEALAAVGAAGADVNLTATSPIVLLAHDATLLLMAALEAGAGLAGRGLLPTSGDALIDFLRRNVSVSGASGTVSLLPSGDRRQSRYVVFNARGGAEKRVASVSGEGHLVARLDGAQATLLILGQLTREFPAATTVVPSDAGEKMSPLLLTAFVAAGVAATLGVTVAAAGLVLWRCGSRRRDHSLAPQDAAVPCTIVFTDIEASTALWARVPEAMSLAVEAHHEIVREAIDEHGGYEVKTVGDAFMVAFKDPADALRFASNLQLRLFEHQWSHDIDAAYQEFAGDAKAPALCAGLRVRAGVHHGLCRIQRDRITDSYDYYGTTVNIAARVEAVAHGGQVCATGATLEAAGGAEACAAQLHAALLDLGPQLLRGLDEPLRLQQVLPRALAERTFPPLRLQCAAPDPDENDASDDSRHQRGEATGSPLPTTNRESAEERSALSASIQVKSHHRVALDTALGPLGPKARATVVCELARHWRVAGGRNAPRLDARRLTDDPDEMNRLIALVSGRVGRAMRSAAQLSMKQQWEGAAPIASIWRQFGCIAMESTRAEDEPPRPLSTMSSTCHAARDGLGPLSPPADSASGNAVVGDLDCASLDAGGRGGRMQPSGA